MSYEPFARAPCVAHPDAVGDQLEECVEAYEEQPSCVVALSIDKVVHIILTNLDYRRRLASAALVCQQWSTVATEVTTGEGIDKSFGYRSFDDPPEESSLGPWLEKYGHRVPSITICSGRMFLKPQPFMSALTRVTSLELCCIRIVPEALSCLAASLKSLQSLTFRHMYMDVWDNVAKETLFAPYHKPWQQVWVGCPQLTYIKVESCDMEAESLEGMTALQHLKELVLVGNRLRTAAYINPLPPSLTALSLEEGSSCRQYTRVDVSTALSQHTQLTDLNRPTASSASAAQGSRLQSLQISGMDLNDPLVLSSLTSLSALHASGMRSDKARKLLVVLPGLSKLRILDLSIEHSSWHSDRQNPSFGTADLQRLVSCCPDLEVLAIEAAFLPPTPARRRGGWFAQFESDSESDTETEPCSLLPLQDATRLTHLTLYAQDFLQDGNLAQLATLTALQSLTIRKSGCRFTDEGVQELTQLTALTRLCVEVDQYAPISRDLAPGSEHIRYISIYSRMPGQVGEGWSVSKHLASLCAKSSVLHPKKPEPAPDAGPSNATRDNPLRTQRSATSKTPALNMPVRSQRDAAAPLPASTSGLKPLHKQRSVAASKPTPDKPLRTQRTPAANMAAPDAGVRTQRDAAARESTPDQAVRTQRKAATPPIWRP